MMLRDVFRDSLAGVYNCGGTDSAVLRSEFISAAEMISSGVGHVFTKFFVSLQAKDLCYGTKQGTAHGVGLRGEHGAEHLPDGQGGDGQDDLPEDCGGTFAQAAHRGGPDGCGCHQRRWRDDSLVLPTAALALRAGGKGGKQVRLRAGETQDYCLHRLAHHRRDFDGPGRPPRRHRQCAASFPRPLPALRRCAAADDRRLGTAHARCHAGGRAGAEAFLLHALLLRLQGVAAD